MANGKVNIQTISNKTGFSPATISNALNNKRGVKKETADRIFEVARELGYITESYINKVRFVIYRRAGSLIIDNPFFNKVLIGAEEVCSEYGFEILITYLDMRLSSYEDDVRAVLDDVNSGIIVFGSEVVEEEVPRFLTAKGPVIFIDYWMTDMDFECVVNNGYDSVRRMIKYILKKGHTKIGYLRGELRIPPFVEREQAVRDTLAAAGLPLKDEYIFNVQISMEGSYTSMRELLKSKPPLPTAFFADNDVIALGAMRAMQEAGIRLPEQVSVAGYDDVPSSEISTPRLTTIHTEMEELGRQAALKIFKSAENPELPKSKLVYATRFVERDSVYDLTKAKKK